MKTKAVSYRTIFVAIILLLSTGSVLIFFWNRTVNSNIKALEANIHGLQIPSLTTHQFNLIKAVIIPNHQRMVDGDGTYTGWPQDRIQDAIITNLAQVPLDGFAQKLLHSKLYHYINTAYRDDELVFIYMALPHVGGKFTLEEFSKELFNRKISDLDNRELALLLAAGFNADSNLKFSEIQRVRSEIVTIWKDHQLITSDAFEQALFWMPNQILRRHKSFGYYHMIENAAHRHGVDPVLLLALVQAESAGNPRAISRAGAIGLAQLMPATASELRPDIQIPFQLYEPEINIELGAEYLATVISWSRNHFKNASEEEIVNFALAAYNAGWSRVRRANGIPNIPETRYYVQRVNWYYEQFSRVLYS